MLYDRIDDGLKDPQSHWTTDSRRRSKDREHGPGDKGIGRAMGHNRITAAKDIRDKGRARAWASREGYFGIQQQHEPGAGGSWTCEGDSRAGYAER
jgi:hypothetical protein